MDKTWCAACDRPSRVKLSRKVELVKVVGERWVCRKCPKRDEDAIGLALDLYPQNKTRNAAGF